MNICSNSLHMIPTMVMGFTTVSQWCRVWVCPGKVPIFSVLVFDLKFVSTASLQKISNWRQHSDWKITLSLCTVRHHWSGTATLGLQARFYWLYWHLQHLHQHFALAPATCMWQ